MIRSPSPFSVVSGLLGLGLFAGHAGAATYSGPIFGVVPPGVHRIKNDPSQWPGVYVPGGQTVTISPGAILKFDPGASFDVYGGIVSAIGTAANPIVFTSMRDDAAGGDTNGDGPSSGAAGDWKALIFVSGDSPSVFEHVDVRFTGEGGWSTVSILNVQNHVFRRCTIRDGLGQAVYIVGAINSSRPVIEDCHFANHFGGFVGRALDNLANVDGVTTSGLTFDRSQILEGNLFGPATIGGANMIGKAIHFESGLVIGPGKDLTLGAGAVLKFKQNAPLIAQAKLVVAGTAGDPVILTSATDDSVGGDTNGDGASTGDLEAWAGTQFWDGSSGSRLDFASVRHTNAGLWLVHPVTVHARDCEFLAGNGSGIYLSGHDTPSTFVRNRIVDHAGSAFEAVTLRSVPNFLDNVATGNGGDWVRVTNGAMSGGLTIGPENLVGGVLLPEFTNVTVPLGSSLRLKAGTIVKAGDGAVGIDVAGALFLDGTAEAPVVFTAKRDDSIGGDSNGDGAASSPASANWRGIDLLASGTGVPSVLRHALVRYGGAGAYGFRFGHGLVAARGLRVERCFASAIRIEAGGVFGDLVAWNSGGHGIELGGGNALITRSTAALNSLTGFFAAPAFAGSVTSSVSFGNSGSGSSGFIAGQVRYSNGFVGFTSGNGNFHADPSFVDLAGGDLRLAAGSPNVDAGDPLDNPKLVQDGARFPRFLDGNLDGTMRVDIGAHEHSNVELEVGDIAAPGGVLPIATTGSSGLSTLLFVGMQTNAVHLPPAGALLIDLSAPYLLLPFGSTPTQALLPIPPALPTPLPIFFQALVISGPAANLSNPEIVVVQ